MLLLLFPWISFICSTQRVKCHGYAAFSRICLIVLLEWPSTTVVVEIIKILDCHVSLFRDTSYWGEQKWFSSYVILQTASVVWLFALYYNDFSLVLSCLNVKWNYLIFNDWRWSFLLIQVDPYTIFDGAAGHDEIGVSDNIVIAFYCSLFLVLMYLHVFQFPSYSYQILSSEVFAC